MNRRSLGHGCVTAAAACLAWSILGAPAVDGDDAGAALQRQRQALEAAWNKHDAPALSAFFAEDADLTTAFGRRALGRAEILKTLAFEHTGKGPMAEVRLGPDTSVARHATADVAVTDTSASRVAPEAEEPADDRNQLEVRVTNVWRRSGSTWLVYASRMAIKPPTMGPPKGPRQPPRSR